MDKTRMALVFNEWMRRYILDPRAFEVEFQTVIRHITELSKVKTPSYGESCAAYMIQLDDELSKEG